MSLAMVYIPCGNDEEARQISAHLVSKGLAACTGAWPVKSTFNWKGELACEAETVILAKTLEEKYEDIITEVERLHSYDIPAIVKFKIEANEKYEKWLQKELDQQKR